MRKNLDSTFFNILYRIVLNRINTILISKIKSKSIIVLKFNRGNQMSDSENISDEKFWGNVIRKHWIAFILFILAIVFIIIDAVSVLIWHVETSHLGGQGDWTFNQWSLSGVIIFIVVLILWELLFVGVPAGLIFGLGGYFFWTRLPQEEQQLYRNKDKSEKNGGTRDKGGDIVGFLIFIAFCIYIAIDGNFNTTFGLLPYSYFIYAWLYTIMWLLIIFGVPAAIILIIVYFKVWRK